MNDLADARPRHARRTRRSAGAAPPASGPPPRRLPPAVAAPAPPAGRRRPRPPAHGIGAPDRWRWLTARRRRPAGRRGLGAGVVLRLTATGGRGPAIVQEREATAAPERRPPGSVEAAARTILPSVVQVRAGSGSGSGVVMDDRGHVLTNHHVVAGADEVTLVLVHRPAGVAEVIGSDRANDIAVLRATGGRPARRDARRQRRPPDRSGGDRRRITARPQRHRHRRRRQRPRPSGR